MANFNRRQTPKVKDGRVQKKNRHALTPNYWSHAPKVPVIDKERPGQGYKHFLRRPDILTFISILPEWDELSKGLRAVILAQGGDGYDGSYYHKGVVEICAWPREKWVEANKDWYSKHQELLQRLEIVCEKLQNGLMLCKFNVSQIRAYQLLHIFLHELGHHHDQMTTRSKWRPARGENYAETYAFAYEQEIWQRYILTFGLPG